MTENELAMFLVSNALISEGTANADVIEAKIIQELKDKNLDIRKLVRVGTDEASVMTGYVVGKVE